MGFCYRVLQGASAVAVVLGDTKPLSAAVARVLNVLVLGLPGRPF